MTEGDITRTTTYLVQFTGLASRQWVDVAREPFATVEGAAAWIEEKIPTHTSRIIKRTITDEIASETEA